MSTHFDGSAEEQRALDVYIKLTRCAESVNARINQRLSDLKLTISQFGVLEALYHLGPMHQNELGQKILRSSGNMTMVIDNLCKRGLVERCRNEEDRRYVRVSLTPAGQQLIHDYFPEHVKIVLEEIGVLSPAEQEKLQHLCKKLGLGKVG
ncbi:MAG: winged helix-turn-helix transcriptional regulator [Caldilineaceae bacterium]|nr:winged helix-turn-helix transcriptional regulator [Caldilineaceae bacterium]